MTLPLTASAFPPEGFTSYEGIIYKCYPAYYDPLQLVCSVYSGKNVSGDINIPQTIAVVDYDEIYYYTVFHIEHEAFIDCTDITSVTLPNSIRSIGAIGTGTLPDEDGLWGGVLYNDGGAFEGCISLKSINIPNSMEFIGQRTFHGCTSLESIEIPNSVTTIGPRAFQGCKALTSVKLGDNIENLWDCTFAGCWGLSNIIIPSSVRIIGKNCFQESSLKSISLPEHLTLIHGGAFYNCRALKSVYIPSSIEIDIPANSLFWSCQNLEEINVGENNPKYTSIDGVMFNKEVTELLLHPRGRTGHYDIPETVTLIGERSFYYSNINSISIPNTVNMIDIEAFSESNLTDISIPESVSIIKQEAFSNCDNLESVKIPASIVDFGERIFSSCDYIGNVCYYATDPISADEEMFTEDVYNNAELFVRTDALDKIKDIVPWKYFIQAADIAGTNEISDITNNRSEVYTLEGVKIPDSSKEKLTPGIYIIRKGKTSKKINIK